MTYIEQLNAEEAKLAPTWKISRNTYLIGEAEKTAQRGKWHEFEESRVVAIPSWPKGVRFSPLFGGLTATPKALGLLENGESERVRANVDYALVHAADEEAFWPAMLMMPPVEFTDDGVPD